MLMYHFKPSQNFQFAIDATITLTRLIDCLAIETNRYIVCVQANRLLQGLDCGILSGIPVAPPLYFHFS